MADFAEERAMMLRWALGVKGVAGPGDVRRLVDFLGEFVDLAHSPNGSSGHYQRRADGGASLRVPVPTAGGWDETHALLHELGHALMEPAPGESVRDLVEIEEAADTFRLAFLLPRALVFVASHSSADLLEVVAWQAGISEGALGLLATWQAAHPAPSFAAPPPWCAWTHYRARTRRTRYHRALVLVRMDGAARYEWPCRDEEELRQVRAEREASLLSLRPHEFALQNRGREVRFEEVTLHERSLLRAA